MISEFLFYEDDVAKSEKSHYIDLKIQVRELLKDRFNRQLLTEVLLDLKKDVSGDTRMRLLQLYQDLGLHNDAFAKLHSWRWEVIAKGISQLTEMQVESAYSFISKFINDRRSTVRKQAEIAIVTLKPEGINYFLDTTRYKISEWQQLKLLDVLRNRETFDPPRFKLWLTSTNRHVVLFALRLIKYYNQNDANSSLVELLKHKTALIRLEAIECIKEFNVVEALPVLKKVFYKSNTDIKIAILGTIGELGGQADTGFLHAVAQREGHFSVKSKALAAINMIAPETVMPTEGIDHFEVEPVEREILDSTYKTDENMEEGVRPQEPLADLTISGKEDQSAVEAGLGASDMSTALSVVTSEAATGLGKGLVGATASRETGKKGQCGTAQEHVPPSVSGGKGLRSVSPGLGPPANIIFLPPVTPSDPSPYPSFDKTNSMKDATNHGPDILNLEVCYEEIRAMPGRPDRTDQPQIHSDDIDFLPPTAGNEEEGKTENDLVAQGFSNAVDDPGFVPGPVDMSDGIEGYGLSDFEVEFVKAEDRGPIEDIGFELEEAPYSVEDEGDQDDVLTWLLLQNELNEIEVEYEEVTTDLPLDDQWGHLIPEPVYYDHHETYMMGLLDDLEEMGDHREIPLLEELLAAEKKNFIKDRIVRMIKLFSRQHDGHTTTKKNYVEELNLPFFSVFADLFKNIDREAKLILLDEVVAVGDEKEIKFLDGLLEHPDTEIRDKAHQVLKLLVDKMAREKQSEKDKKKESEARETKALFDRQMAEENPEVDYTEDEFHQLLDEMEIEPSADPEVFEIDFEPEEALDRCHSKEILDMPVVATEVSHNGASFLFQLYRLQRNFMCKLNG